MSSPFLSNLGIDVFHQARSPTADGFPTTFSPSNRLMWQQAVMEYKPSGTALQDWGLAIKLYVRICEDQGVFPFQNTHIAKNDQIHYYLEAQRNQIVRFINRSKLMDEIKLRKTYHRATLTDKGFILTVYAWCNIKDPSFPQWLMRMPYPRFNMKREADGRYVKPLAPGLEMFAENDGINMPERWHVGYEIQCPFFPDLPSIHTPSKGELEKFVIDTLWMPILREIRPTGLAYRLI